MRRYNNLTPLPHDNFVKTLTIPEVSNTASVSDGSDTTITNDFPEDEHYVALGLERGCHVGIENNPLCGF
jgi:hypothetical protein